MPILKTITENVDGETLNMEEQVYVVRVENGGQTYWRRGNTFTWHIERADGFENIEAATAAVQNAYRFMAPAIRNKCVIIPHGGDFVRD